MNWDSATFNLFLNLSGRLLQHRYMTKQAHNTLTSDMFARENEPTISNTELNQENTRDKNLCGGL